MRPSRSQQLKVRKAHLLTLTKQGHGIETTPCPGMMHIFQELGPHFCSPQALSSASDLCLEVDSELQDENTAQMTPCFSLVKTEQRRQLCQPHTSDRKNYEIIVLFEADKFMVICDTIINSNA